MSFVDHKLLLVALLSCSAAGGLLTSRPLFGADAPRVTAALVPDASKVASLLFEADVHWKLDQAERAHELYKKSDLSGTCPPSLVAAYEATQGGGEQLYLDMQAARRGDMTALRGALDRLYLKRTDPYADPKLALELYERAKQSNPNGTFENEREIAELLTMAAAPGPFDIAAVLKKHSVIDGGSAQTEDGKWQPYFLWDLAEEASLGGAFGKPDPALVLQLVARGPGEISERISAVRAAFAFWKLEKPGRFTCTDHLSSHQGVRHAVRRMLLHWDQDQKRRAAKLLAQAGVGRAESTLKEALESAEQYAQQKGKHLHFTNRYEPGWQSALVFRWEFEKSIRLLESVFSGWKPDFSPPLSQSLERFQQWCAAAESKVPAHLIENGLVNSAGPYLAFAGTEDLKEVIRSSEVYINALSGTFAQFNPALPMEEWKSWLLAGILRDFDGSVHALERWDPAPAPTQKPVVPGDSKDRAKTEEKEIEKDLSAIRAGMKSDHAALFDSMKDAAFEWIERQAAMAGGGDSGGAGADFAMAAQQKWLLKMKPLLSGFIPSRLIPGRLAETVLNAQAKASKGLSSSVPGREEAETAAWLEYRNRAIKLLAKVSPLLGEEDWKGWFSEERAWELPDCALAYTEGERERLADEKYERNREAFEKEFKQREAVFKDPRTMELDLGRMEIPGLACSEDGMLRILSWDTETGGTMHNYCVLSQFKSPDGRVGYAVLHSEDRDDDKGTTNVGVFGAVGNKIETIVTKSQGTVYLLSWHARAATRSWAEGVAAVRLNNSHIKSVPFFRTKKELLSHIEINYGYDSLQAGAEIKFEKTNGYTVQIPAISGRDQFSGKFLQYIFDGNNFVYRGVK